MKIRIIAAAALCIAPALHAQGGGVSSQCATTVTQDACQKTIDVFNYLAPQLGTVIAGGNATLGVGGTIGGLGHIYVSGRANIISANIPQINQVTPSTSGAVSSQYPTNSQVAGIPQADVAIGIFRGIPLGVTNVGGIDALVSASYLPSLSASGVDLKTTGGSIKFGGGVRIGIVQESIVFPGVSLTYLHRALPTVDLRANSGSDTLRINGIDLKSDSWRVVASKNLLLLGLAVGAGQDRFDASASGSAYIAARGVGSLGSPASTVGPISLSQKITRTTYFADATLNFPLIKLIGEIGQSGSVNVPTFNTFQGSAPGSSQIFGAVGLRLGL